MNTQIVGAIDTAKLWEGKFSCNFYDRDGRLQEKRDLGSNLVVDNAKLVMAHILGQTATASVINGVKAYDPRISTGDGGLNGGVSISQAGWNPTPTQLRPLYMAFGAEAGSNPGITQKGLYRPINKTGAVGGLPSETIASYFYGGTDGDNAFVVQYLPNTDGITDAWVRFITRMKTFQGQLASGGSSQQYQEAGLFTTLFVPSSDTTPAPIMIARKTFPTITKTAELELEFVWELRF